MWRIKSLIRVTQQQSRGQVLQPNKADMQTCRGQLPTKVRGEGADTLSNKLT